MRFSALISLCVACVCAAASPASGQTPDTPAGRQLAAWLAAYNSGNRDTLLKFLRADFPSRAPDIDQVMMRRLNMTGGFDLKKVEEASPTRIAGVLKMHDLEQYVRFTIAVDSAPPHVIRALDVLMIDRPPEFPSPRTTETEALAELRSKVESEVDAGRFSGALIIAKDGRPIFSRAYGLADREHNTRNTLQTKFRMGSMNKAFTAIAVLQLVQAGKVTLTAPIGRYLPDYPNREIRTKVTVGMLLQHTGGTGDIFGPEYTAHRAELRTLRDYVSLYGGRPPEFEPGARRAYSNYGYLLLGLLIERASGQSYYDYVEDHLLAPAGMTGTGSEPENVAVSGRAVGYTLGPTGAWQPATDQLPYRGTSAGGGYTTVEDLLRFANGLTSGALLAPEYLELFARGDPGRPIEQRIPYGAGGRVWDGAVYFGHNGGFPGMNGDLEIGYHTAYVIIVLTNIDPPAAQRISEFAGSRLPVR